MTLVHTKAYLPADLWRALDLLAARTGRPRSEIVRAAVASFLSADNPEQLEAALGRRLDRLDRRLDRIERDLAVGVETIGLFFHTWLIAAPPMADEDREEAEARGDLRFAQAKETIGRRLAAGRSYPKEIPADLAPVQQARVKPEEDPFA